MVFVFVLYWEDYADTRAPARVIGVFRTLDAAIGRARLEGASNHWVEAKGEFGYSSGWHCQTGMEVYIIEKHLVEPVPPLPGSGDDPSCSLP